MVPIPEGKGARNRIDQAGRFHSGYAPMKNLAPLRRGVFRCVLSEVRHKKPASRLDVQWLACRRCLSPVP
jgi:hypothetical protein